MARDFDDRDDLNGDDLGGQRMDPRGGGRRLRRRKPRRNCPDYIDWKDVDFLKQFLPERGKILPRRISGVNADCQRRIATAIKRARNMALLPYTTD